MIELETVLILGAGASWDYNFPSGSELVSDICKVIDRLPHRDLLDQIFPGQNQPTKQEFIQVLKKAKPYSIDAWLEHNQRFLEIGKAAIAMTLLDYELRTHLRDRAKGDWYQLLFQRLNCPFEKFQENDISIITFNYDRSLEHFLFETLTNTYKEKSELACAEKLSQLKILHVYGSLGRLGWQSDDPENPVPKVNYGAAINKDTVISAASCIRIISEKNEDLPIEFQQARDWIKEAKAVYFLGFGYHELNMQRLGVETLEPRPPKVMGTAYNLDYQRIREVEKLNIRGDFSIRHGGIVRKTVYEFLYNYIDFNDGGLPDPLIINS
jgi:hypothetical protein